MRYGIGEEGEVCRGRGVIGPLKCVIWQYQNVVWHKLVPSFMHEAVYAALKHYPEIKVDEILSMIHSSRRTLYRILADLRENGFVENTGNKNHPKWRVYNG